GGTRRAGGRWMESTLGGAGPATFSPPPPRGGGRGPVLKPPSWGLTRARRDLRNSPSSLLMQRLWQAAAPLIQGRFVPVWREYAAACLQQARSNAHASATGTSSSNDAESCANG